MWVMTPFGFYSVVADRNGPDLLIRARVRKDLVRVNKLLGKPAQIETTTTSDYPFRMRLSRSRWAWCLEVMTSKIDYTNFKSEIGKKDLQRAHIYTDVWRALQALEQSHFIAVLKLVDGRTVVRRRSKRVSRSSSFQKP